MSGKRVAVDSLGVRREGRTSWRPESVNLTVDSGDLRVLAGPCGSGKSTTARVLTGLAAADAGLSFRGSAVIAGHDAVSEGERVSWPDFVSAVGQDPDAQVTCRTVAEEVASGLEFRRIASQEIEKRTHEALAKVGLSSLAAEEPFRLSGGQRQRLAVACALAAATPVTVLDEPVANLDPDGAQDVAAAAAELRSNHAAVLVIDHGSAAFQDGKYPVTVLARDGNTAGEGPWSPHIPVTHTNRTPGAVVARVQGAHLRTAGKTRLHDASITLRAGEIHALVGDNGAGKSSLFGVIAGSFRHKPVPDGLVDWAFQNPEHQFSALTVDEELRRARLRGVDQTGDGSSRSLDAETLDNLVSGLIAELPTDQPPHQLSGGQKRLLGVACAMLSNRPLLLLDEPTAHLDERGLAALARALGGWAQAGGAVLFTCHDERVVRAWADRVTVLRRGTSVWAGDIAQWPGMQDDESGKGSISSTALLPSSTSTSWSAHDVQAVRAMPFAGLNPLTCFPIMGALIALAFVLPGATGRLYALMVSIGILTIITPLRTGPGLPRRVAGVALRWAIVAIVTVVFGLLALRGTAYSSGGGESPWEHAASHGLLLGTVCAATLVAGCIADATDIVNAAAQRLRLPAMWAAVANSGLAIARYLRHTGPIARDAAKLRAVRPGRRFHNGLVRLISPFTALVPIFVDAIHFSRRLADTLTLRGLGLSRPRTYLRAFPWKIRDTIVTAVCIILPLVIAGLLL